MIGFEQHVKIRELLDKWSQLSQLYITVQTPGHLTVQVLGSARPEFYEGALQIALKTLKQKAQFIKADLQQLDFDTSQLPPLTEVIREPAQSN